jgi:hypothetical protein
VTTWPIDSVVVKWSKNSDGIARQASAAWQSNSGTISYWQASIGRPSRWRDRDGCLRCRPPVAQLPHE